MITSSSSKTVETNSLTESRITIRVPREYHQQPVISTLISRYGLTVNIAGAILTGNGNQDGWFDLQLRGTQNQIMYGLAYLDEQKIEIWRKPTSNELLRND
ncbi:MAG: NIL domain-containing protein [Cyanobacteriota bacterium]|nr:NIL domain-containing protein [Cyanobacteriota bacterium]